MSNKTRPRFVTQRVPLAEQKLLTLSDHWSSVPVFNGVGAAQSRLFCVTFGRLSIVLSQFDLQILNTTLVSYCLSLDLQILIITLVFYCLSLDLQILIITLASYYLSLDLQILNTTLLFSNISYYYR